MAERTETRPRTAEDVKRDPIRGDILRHEWLKFGDTAISGAAGNFVWIARNGLSREAKQTRKTFHKWAKSAEVIHIAQPKE